MRILRHLRHFPCTLLLVALAWLGVDIFAQKAPGEMLAPELRPFVESNTLAGAVVLVADKDKVLDVEAVGWADIAAKKPMRTDSVFWIASQSKPISAVALMILVDEGKVNVDDAVEKYLPEFKGQQVEEAGIEMHPPRHPILVREVLSHTSGLPFKTAIEEPTLDILSLEERVKSYAKVPLLFEPGTKSKYANAGINTAGRIVEVVSGMSFEQFLDERVFKPLGMTDTTFYPSKNQIERLAKSYKPNATKDGMEETTIAQLKYPLDDPERRPMPAGGLFSTANDLSIFYRMMANGGISNGKRILSEKSVKTMTSDQSGEANSHYGFGFGTDGKSFTHGGAYGTNSRYDRESKLVTIYLVQHAGWSGNGKDILHQFQVAATVAYGAKVTAKAEAADAPLVVGITSAPATRTNSDAKTNASGLVNRLRSLPVPDREQTMSGGRLEGSSQSRTEGLRGFAADVSLPRSSPEAQGISSAAIREFVEAADKTINTLHSFMLVRHGHVIAECWWRPEAAGKPHVLWSLSKSFTSTAVGLAVAEGKLSLDDPVLKFFPAQAPADPSDNLKAMRVRDLLTMSGGHDVEPKFDLDAGPSVKDFLAHPVTHQPGTWFRYNTPGSYLLSAIVTKATGRTVLDFLKPRLFEPLGIENPEWGASAEGYNFGGYGLFIRTEDIAKFGQLYLQKGKWNGRQLLPETWVAAATWKQVDNDKAPSARTSDWQQGYGFQFWRCQHNAFRGDGRDGQICLVLPEQDAVIAITAQTGQMQTELDLVWEKLLPAFRPEPLTADAPALEKMKEALGALTVHPAKKTGR